MFRTPFCLSFPLAVSSSGTTQHRSLRFLSTAGDTNSATAAGRRFCYESGPRPGIRWAGGWEGGRLLCSLPLPFWLMSRPSPLSLLPGTDVSMTVQSNAKAQVENTDRPEVDNKLLQLTSFRQVPLTSEPQFPHLLSGTNDTC